MRTTLITISIFLLYSFLLQSCNVYTGSVGNGGNASRQNPQYVPEEKMVAQGVAISLPPTQVFIGNEGDINEEMGFGNAKEVYINYFKVQFPIAITRNSKFENVIFFFSKYGVDMDKSFVLRTHVMGTNSYIKIHEPIKGSKISTGDPKVRFILFLEGFKTYREKTTTANPISAMPGFTGVMAVTSGSVLVHKVNYSLWDTEKEMAVTYGSVEEKKNVGLSMRKDDWSAILEDVVKDIVKGTQFEK